MDLSFEEQKVIPVDIEREMKKSYIDYAMSVIVGRALPDVRDGLKPVHRSILYAMFEDNLLPDKSYRKSATTVGNVLGRYLPHGDARGL
jgi:DNA gyrase subunit A